MTYERVVSAAIAETASKFRLAEALATDIPPRAEGQAATAAGESPVVMYLAEARQAIIDAGGEDRSVSTLEEYRNTALWVKGSDATTFQWIPGRSFSAHNAARRAGIARTDFAANPLGVQQVSREHTDQRRARSAASNLPPEQKAALVDDLIDELEPERQAEVISRRIADPVTADEVMKSPEARSHAMSAIDRKERSEFKPPPILDPSANPDPFKLLYDLRRVHRILLDIAQQLAQRGNVISAEEGDLVKEEIDWQIDTLSMMKSGIDAGTLDDAIDRILAGDGLS